LGYLRERLDAPDPLCNLGLKALGEGRLGAEEAADVSTTVDKLEAEGFESLLGPGRSSGLQTKMLLAGSGK
jgi:hypothetical protein